MKKTIRLPPFIKLDPLEFANPSGRSTCRPTRYCLFLSRHVWREYFLTLVLYSHSSRPGLECSNALLKRARRSPNVTFGLLVTYACRRWNARSMWHVYMYSGPIWLEELGKKGPASGQTKEMRPREAFSKYTKEIAFGARLANLWFTVHLSSSRGCRCEL